MVSPPSRRICSVMNESICSHHDGWADGEINIINHRWSFPDSTSSLSEISKWSKPSHHPTRLWTLLPPLTVSLHHVSCSYRVSVYQGVCERLLWVIHAVFRSASCYRFNTPAHTHTRSRLEPICVCVIRETWYIWELRSARTIYSSVHEVSLWVWSSDHQGSAQV